jgi:hypothetical protein
MVLIAELKTVTDHERGKVLRFRHMPDTPMMIDAPVWDAFAADHSDALRLWEDDPDGHLLIAAGFSLTRTGLPIVEQATAMLATRDWLPYATTRGRELLEAAVAANRRFLTPLSYGRPAATHPQLVFTDTAEPVAAFADGPGAAVDGAWVWPAGRPMPPLPAEDPSWARGSNMHIRPDTSHLSTDQSEAVVHGHERR